MLVSEEALIPSELDRCGRILTLCDGQSKVELSLSLPLSCSDCAPASCSAAGENDVLAQKLWELSCRLLSVTWE